MARNLLHCETGFGVYRSAPHSLFFITISVRWRDFSVIVFPFIIWFYGSAIVIIRGWGCGFLNRLEDIVAWSDNRPSFTVLGFMAVVAHCRGI
jgi:hypothetical protein